MINSRHVFVWQYNGANIQLLDLPGIIEGASAGKLFSARKAAQCMRNDSMYLLKLCRIQSKKLSQVLARLSSRNSCK